MKLPDVKESRRRLVAHGEQINPNRERELQVLPRRTYTAGSGRQRQVWADLSTLGAKDVQVYTEEDLQVPLSSRGVDTGSLKGGLAFLLEAFGSDQLIVGISGFTGTGFEYEPEATALDDVFGELMRLNNLPGLVVDGGVSTGVLALGANTARRYGISTLGFLPRQGLHAAGVRDRFIVRGHTYEQREQLVGVTPDLLICLGGRDRTFRKARHALRAGSVVMFLGARLYDVRTADAMLLDSGFYRRMADKERVQLWSLWSRGNSLHMAMATALSLVRRYSIGRRTYRYQMLEQLLADNPYGE